MKETSFDDLVKDLKDSAEDLLHISENPTPSCMAIRQCAHMMFSMANWLNTRQPSDQWISVEERLPEDPRTVEVITEGHVDVFGELSVHSLKAKAWRSLPPPPTK